MAMFLLRTAELIELARQEMRGTSWKEKAGPMKLDSYVYKISILFL